MKVSKNHMYKNNNYFIVGNDTSPSLMSFNENAGSNLSFSSQRNLEEFFLVFFDDEVWKFLVDSTNEYADHKLRNRNVNCIL